MRKSILISGLLLLICSLFFIGCSDDDECPACPELVQKGIVMGDVTLNSSYLGFSLYILGTDGFAPSINSIRFESQEVEFQSTYGEIGGMVYGAYEGSSAGYNSGDDVDIYILTPTGTCSTTVSLLHDPDDEPEVIDWATNYPHDTVAIGEEIEVHWHPVPNVDWYHLEFDYSYDSMGTHVYNDVETFTTDTTFTIPGSGTQYNGYYYLYINPVIGPRPDATEGNVAGSALDGIIASSGYFNFQVYVGNGDAWPVGIAPQDETPEKTRISEFIWNYQSGK
ncbi:MAG: hypothetical protein GY841_20835 [FCB group bacterium]|nr:hypothetical protein [FCB group bacterium]